MAGRKTCSGLRAVKLIDTRKSLLSRAIGSVWSVPEFTDHPAVVNGASDLLVKTPHWIASGAGLLTTSLTRCPAYPPFFALPFFQNGRLTTSAASRSPRHSTSNFDPILAAAAGR